MELGEAVVASEPTNVTYKRELGDHKENLAALLAVRPDLPVHDPAKATRLAQEATTLGPEKASHWKALSIAHYRNGNWNGCVEAMAEALRRVDNRKLDPDDRLFLAMARWRLGEKDAARTLFNQAAAELAKIQTPEEDPLRLRAEAAALLGLSDAPTLDGVSDPPVVASDAEKPK